jgi:hypothetical protein
VPDGRGSGRLEEKIRVEPTTGELPCMRRGHRHRSSTPPRRCGVVLNGDDRPDRLLYLAPGQQLTGKLRFIQF